MKRAVRLYVLVTQFIFSMVVLGLLGAMLGKHVDPDGNGQSLYAGIGLVLALFLNMILIFQFLRNERLRKDD